MKRRPPSRRPTRPRPRPRSPSRAARRDAPGRAPQGDADHPEDQADPPAAAGRPDLRRVRRRQPAGSEVLQSLRRVARSWPEVVKRPWWKRLWPQKKVKTLEVGERPGKAGVKAKKKVGRETMLALRKVVTTAAIVIVARDRALPAVPQLGQRHVRPAGQGQVERLHDARVRPGEPGRGAGDDARHRRTRRRTPSITRATRSGWRPRTARRARPRADLRWPTRRPRQGHHPERRSRRVRPLQPSAEAPPRLQHREDLGRRLEGLRPTSRRSASPTVTASRRSRSTSCRPTRRSATRLRRWRSPRSSSSERSNAKAL